MNIVEYIERVNTRNSIVMICIGDWVELNSGSPPLFVSHVFGDRALVTWVNDKGIAEELGISLVCLKPWVIK